jgi:hypothetical protein
MKARSTRIIILIISMLPIAAMAQDLHFSQWFNSPLTTNPANAGFIPDADYRFGANYRNQWSSISLTKPSACMAMHRYSGTGLKVAG